MKGIFNKITLSLIAIALIALCLLIWWLASGTKVEHDDEGYYEITPVQIEKIREIGQWELLSVSDEEIVDTVRKGFFNDDELTRLYFGTLSIGINMKDTREGWIKMDNDTVIAVLPPVKLLDDNFIDEARTKTFSEDGKWSEEARGELTRKAERVMKARCLTKANYASAEKNAIDQMTSMIKAMGFKHVRCSIQPHQQVRP